MQIALSVVLSLSRIHSFMLSLPPFCVLWCFIWYPTIKPLFELPSIVYGFFLWGETESCLKGLQSRRLPSYWCRGVLPSSLLDQSLTSHLFYGWGHFTERILTTLPQRFAKRYRSDSRRKFRRNLGMVPIVFSKKTHSNGNGVFNRAKYQLEFPEKIWFDS